MGAHDDDEQEVTSALVEELMKKSGLCWLRLPGADRDLPVWHIWHEGSAYIVSGPSEQPVPGIEDTDRATVIVRTKDSRQRMAAWLARVTTLHPGDSHWDEVVRALVAARLNLTDMNQAAQRWARECVVTRLAPTGLIEEGPGEMPSGDLAATPLPTPATTRRGLPRVLHRRQSNRPKLH